MGGEITRFLEVAVGGNSMTMARVVTGDKHSLIRVDEVSHICPSIDPASGAAKAPSRDPVTLATLTSSLAAPTATR